MPALGSNTRFQICLLHFILLVQAFLVALTKGPKFGGIRAEGQTVRGQFTYASQTLRCPLKAKFLSTAYGSVLDLPCGS